jgi:undecaprenyl-diphosphatase
MDYLQASALALLQGLTEFLPISSSAHLILMPVLFGWEDQGLAFDVAVHVGTLLAVIWYFKVDIKQLVVALYADVVGGVDSADARLARAIFLASLPIVFIGFAVYALLADMLRNPLLIATTTLVFGLLLWWADRAGSRDADETSLTTGKALLIGCAQIFALIPGVSRSGVTITAGLALGLTRKAAARFSFLLSIPVILAAGSLSFVDLVRQPGQISWGTIAVGTLVSAVTAYLCIYYFLALVERIGVLPFVIYRTALAVLLFSVFL